MKYLVEQMLPARFLLELGIYLQTCAHLELAIWQIIIEAKGISTQTTTIPVAHVETKLSTERLRKELRQAAKLVNPSLAVRVHHLANEIDAGILSRNAAAHGAFFIDHDLGALGVSHFFAQGKKPSRAYYSLEEPITEGEIEKAMTTADRLLREAIEIRTCLRSRPLRPPPPSPPPPSTAARP